MLFGDESYLVMKVQGHPFPFLIFEKFPIGTIVALLQTNVSSSPGLCTILLFSLLQNIVNSISTSREVSSDMSSLHPFAPFHLHSVQFLIFIGNQIQIKVD